MMILKSCTKIEKIDFRRQFLLCLLILSPSYSDATEMKPVVRNVCYEEILQETEEEMALLGQLDDLDVIVKIRNRFEVENGEHRKWSYREVFFRSVLEETISFGYQTPKEVESFLHSFKNLPADKKNAFIHNVVNRIDLLVEKIRFSSSEADKIAKKLNVKKNNLNDFVHEWSTFRNSDPQNKKIKNIILKILDDGSDDYNKKIVGALKTKMISKRYPDDFIYDLDKLPQGSTVIQIEDFDSTLSLNHILRKIHITDIRDVKEIVESKLVPKILENLKSEDVPLYVSLKGRKDPLVIKSVNYHKGYADLEIDGRAYRFQSKKWKPQFDKADKLKKRFKGKFVAVHNIRRNKNVKRIKGKYIKSVKYSNYKLIVSDKPKKLTVVDVKLNKIIIEFEDQDIDMSKIDLQLESYRSPDKKSLIISYKDTKGEFTTKYISLSDARVIAQHRGEAQLSYRFPQYQWAILNDHIELFDPNTGRLEKTIPLNKDKQFNHVDQILNTNRVVIVYTGTGVVWDYELNKVISIIEPYYNPDYRTAFASFSQGQYIRRPLGKGHFSIYDISSPKAKIIEESDFKAGKAKRDLDLKVQLPTGARADHIRYDIEQDTVSHGINLIHLEEYGHTYEPKANSKSVVFHKLPDSDLVVRKTRVYKDSKTYITFDVLNADGSFSHSLKKTVINREYYHLFSSPDGKTLISNEHYSFPDTGDYIMFWDIKTGNLVKRIKIKSAFISYTRPSYDKSGNYFSVGARYRNSSYDRPPKNPHQINDDRVGPFDIYDAKTFKHIKRVKSLQPEWWDESYNWDDVGHEIMGDMTIYQEGDEFVLQKDELYWQEGP